MADLFIRLARTLSNEAQVGYAEDNEYADDDEGAATVGSSFERSLAVVQHGGVRGMWFHVPTQRLVVSMVNFIGEGPELRVLSRVAFTPQEMVDNYYKIRDALGVRLEMPWGNEVRAELLTEAKGVLSAKS